MRAMAVGMLSGLLACGGDDAGSSPETPGFSAAWSEFATPAGLDASLSLLTGRDVAIHVAWPAASVGDPALAALVRRAADADVEIRPWLLLATADGYWPGSSNADLFAAAAQQLMDQWEADGLAPTTLLVDMELRIDRAALLQEMLTAPEPDIVAIIDLLQAGIDPPQFEAARLSYAALVDEAHERGWQVALTTLPQMLDDYADGDDQLRQAFGIPIDGIDWDVMTFQAYRTLFGDLLAGLSETRPTSYFVYDHALLARELFGDRAGVDIGLVGAGVTPSSTYVDGADLLLDVEAALAAGVPRQRINVYNLDGIMARAPSEQWLRAPPVSPAAPPADDATAESHATNAALDGVLQSAP
jgi:hypothetical protein